MLIETEGLNSMHMVFMSSHLLIFKPMKFILRNVSRKGPRLILYLCLIILSVLMIKWYEVRIAISE
jgi:hypothetical protein